jgi:hypothetical protein
VAETKIRARITARKHLLHPVLSVSSDGDVTRWWWFPEKHSMGIIILRGESQKSLKPTSEPNRLDDFHLSNAAFTYLLKFFKNL